MKYLQRFIAAAAVLLVGAQVLPPTAHAESPTREYQVKAAFVFNFAQFTDWPATAFDTPDAPLVITVVGTNPYGNAIEQVTRDKKVGGRDVNVRYVANASAVGRTHVLVVCPSENGRAGGAVNAAAKSAVLTVGEGEDFSAIGGVVRFFAEDNKLRFEINPAAAQRAGLKVSAKLMQLARIYKEG
jgi:hypothetical protein